MENIWGSQRKTANMERGGLREENRRAHEEDERFRITAVKAAGQVRQRMRSATGESDEVIRRKFMLPERYILTLMTVETLGQERMLLDLMAGGRLGADLVLCGRRSFYADMLLRTARDRRLALRTNFIYEYSPEELSAFSAWQTAWFTCPGNGGGCSLSSKRSMPGFRPCSPIPAAIG